MRSTLRLALFMLMIGGALLGSMGHGWASDRVPVADLVADPFAFEGPIEVEGELVGDYGFRSDGTMWTQLNDDTYARDAVVDGGALSGSNVGIGVRMPAGLAADLDPPGGYRREGPLIRASGTWIVHDPDRGGETYLDIETLVVVDPGRALEEGPDWLAFGGGFALVAVAGLLAVDSRRRIRAGEGQP